MARHFINSSKADISATVRESWFHNQRVSIKSESLANNFCLGKKLGGSATWNKSYVFQGPATAKGLMIMINLFSL